MATKIQQQLMEKVSKVHKIVVENATKENMKGVNDKVKGIFSQAFNKFNEIVEKNKANIPEINMAEIIAQNQLLSNQNV